MHPLPAAMRAVDEGAGRILLIQLSASEPDGLQQLLHARGCVVTRTRDLAVAACRARREPFDIAVVHGVSDLEAALAACATLARRCGVIVILGGDPRRRLCIEALEAGADDCLAEPCNPREVVARVRALMRSRQRASDRPVRRWLTDNLIIHPAGRVGSICGGSVSLTRAQHRLLEALARRPGEVISRDELFARVYGDDAEYSDRAIDVLVSRLRKRLARLDPRELILCCRGVGYRLSADATPAIDCRLAGGDPPPCRDVAANLADGVRGPAVW